MLSTEKRGAPYETILDGAERRRAAMPEWTAKKHMSCRDGQTGEGASCEHDGAS